MKRMIILMFIVCTSIWSAEAQKMKGDLKALKGEARVNLVFDYEGVMIDGENEEAYVNRNAKEKGEGDEAKWKDNWYNEFHNTINGPEFTKFFNKEAKMECGEFVDAAYTMVVKLTDIDPGNFAGPFSNPCKLTGEIRVVKTGTTEEVAVISFKKLNGNPMQPQLEKRIGSAFAYLGQFAGKVFAKGIK